MADVPEFLEKINLTKKVLGPKMAEEFCWFYAIDRRERVLEDVANYRETTGNPAFLSVIAADLLDDHCMDDMLEPKYCAAPLHLGIMHLTADFSLDPNALVRSSFGLIAPGGILVGATKQQKILDKVLKYSQIIGGACWAPDVFFDGQETACFVVRKIVLQ